MYEHLAVVLEGRYHINLAEFLGNIDCLSDSLYFASSLINASLAGHVKMHEARLYESTCTRA